MNTARRPNTDRKIVFAVSACTVVVLIIGLALHMRAGQVAQRVVVDMFNDQQLAVARGAKHFIESELRDLRGTLTAIALRLAAEPLDPAGYSELLRQELTHADQSGVRKVEYFDTRTGRRWTYLPYRSSALAASTADGGLPPIPAPIFSGGHIWVSPPALSGSEILMSMAAAVPGDAMRIVVFQINISWFLNPYLKNVRSGRTGYAWLVDASGMFLYHPYSGYIGKDAFKARQSDFPDQSFAIVNTIQKERMLKGQEGTGVYSSSWHRGITGEMQKLIAYCPIQMSEDPSRFWSVAVVAPVNEIDDALRRNATWQLITMGLTVGVLLLAAVTIVNLEMRWSQTLGKQVRLRTQALARSQENYRALVESAEDFIFTLDADGCFLSANSFTAVFFGSSPDAIIGKSLESVLSEPVPARMRRHVRQVFESGKSVRDEFELRTGGTAIWISANFMPLRIDAEAASSVLCIARDITENKQLEKQLISTEKLASLGTLAAGVAHEINNPLGVILGFCDLLIRKQLPGTQAYEDLKIIERQGFHCKAIIENLLSFARVDGAGDDGADLNGCLEDIVHIVSHSLEMSGISLDCRLAANIPAVCGDARQLQQVFLNLINNAAAAMKHGGRVMIRTRLTPDRRRAVVEVEDTGPGIPSEALDRIFEPFFTTKPEGEGTGLGLFVSYGIIKKSGGSIDCRTQVADASGRPSGTRFIVHLPIRTQEES